MTTAESSAFFVYGALLIGGSYAFHYRYRCVKASLLPGVVSSFGTIYAVGFLDGGGFNPLRYWAVFLTWGMGLWIISAILSGFIGMPCQVRKD